MNTNNSNNTNMAQSSGMSQKSSVANTGDTLQSEKYMFFSKAEIGVFLKRYQDIILYMDNGTPYINYNVAKNVFESVVGYNYSLEILSYEYIHEFETFLTHVRITLCRDDKKIVKDVIGCEKAKHKKDSNDISNFENLSKSAVKDAFKKFLSDYIGIGAAQFAEAKASFAANNKSFRGNNNNGSNTTQGNRTQSYKCTDCGAAINQKIYDYSVTYHKEKRALCPNCQKKY